jgi:hypothetical protein
LLLENFISLSTRERPREKQLQAIVLKAKQALSSALVRLPESATGVPTSRAMMVPRSNLD